MTKCSSLSYSPQAEAITKSANEKEPKQIIKMGSGGQLWYPVHLDQHILSKMASEPWRNSVQEESTSGRRVTGLRYHAMQQVLIGQGLYYMFIPSL